MAYHNSKGPASEHVYQDTVIWQCTSCNCWSRKEYVSVAEPLCPLCKSKMVEETKNIRLLD
ncbi:MAG: ydjO 1 [Bacilli bacterium]|nr:ydjO 1 [Bacilli bacterium]